MYEFTFYTGCRNTLYTHTDTNFNTQICMHACMHATVKKFGLFVKQVKNFKDCFQITMFSGY